VSVQTSKFLSLILRHHPERVGLSLDAEGWVEVDSLLAAMTRHGHALSRASLEELVGSSDKQRFIFSPDGTRIRANQGHSIPVDLGLTPLVPPDVLFHGTVDKFLDSIRAQGLIRGERQHVHLSRDREVAIQVGKRRGLPVVLEVDAALMTSESIPFYRSENGVWLTEAVPVRFLRGL
jgi:putative RNA 2'-phosphotransferase